jgi:hypothetical protein
MRSYTVLLIGILAFGIGLFVGMRATITPAQQKFEEQISILTMRLNQAEQRSKGLEGRAATLAQENQRLRHLTLSPTPAAQPPAQEAPAAPTPTPA